MAHADDATKAWVSATPTVNADNKVTRWNQTMSRMLSSLDFINLWKSYKPINSEVFRTQ